MTQRQIETSREIRLWLGQIIVPAATIAVTMLTVPEVRQAVGAAANGIKTKIENKFKKGES